MCSAPASAPRHVVRDFATAKVGRWQGVQGLPRFPQKLSVAHATNFSGPSCGNSGHPPLQALPLASLSLAVSKPRNIPRSDKRRNEHLITHHPMNATIQPLSSQSAPAAALSTRPIAHQSKTPHTRSAHSSTINIQERVAAAEKAIKNKFLLLVDILRVDIENGQLSIIFRDILKNRIIEASSTDWRHLTFYDCENRKPLKLK